MKKPVFRASFSLHRCTYMHTSARAHTQAGNFFHMGKLVHFGRAHGLKGRKSHSLLFNFSSSPRAQRAISFFDIEPGRKHRRKSRCATHIRQTYAFYYSTTCMTFGQAACVCKCDLLFMCVCTKFFYFNLVFYLLMASHTLFRFHFNRNTNTTKLLTHLPA